MQAMISSGVWSPVAFPHEHWLCSVRACSLETGSRGRSPRSHTAFISSPLSTLFLPQNRVKCQVRKSSNKNCPSREVARLLMLEVAEHAKSLPQKGRSAHTRVTTRCTHNPKVTNQSPFPYWV